MRGVAAAVISVCCASWLATPAAGAIVQDFSDRSAFLAGLGGLPTVSQDFSGFPSGTDFRTTEITPGVTATFLGDGNVESSPTVFFETLFRDPDAPSISQSVFRFDFAVPYRGFGFDVGSFDPDTPGPVTFVVETVDGTVADFSFTPTNASEADPFFFGAIASDGLRSLLYAEGPEEGGSATGLLTRANCCEETVIDDVVGAIVPLPAALPLLLSGLVGIGLAARRAGDAERG